MRLAKQYGRYGYRKIARLLQIEGWRVKHKKVERLWREESLRLPHRHKRLSGSTIRIVPPSVSDPSIPITSGAWTSSTTSSAMGSRTRCDRPRRIYPRGFVRGGHAQNVFSRSTGSPLSAAPQAQQAPPPSPTGNIYEDFVPCLGDVDRYEIPSLGTSFGLVVIGLSPE